MTDFILLDFETHFDKDYTLKKMPTAQYVRDPRFKILGMAWLRGHWPAKDGRPAWSPGDAAISQYNAMPANLPVVGHNLAFDALVLNERVIPPHRVPSAPPMYLDTMLMARYCVAQGILPPDVRTSLAALARHFDLPEKGDTADAVAAGGDELAEYGRHDVWLTHEILKRLMPHVPAFELQLMHLHIQMAVEPVLGLDTQLCRDEIEANTMPEALKKECGSSEKFAALLRKVGIEPATKTSPATGKQTYAFAKTDPFMQELLQHENPVVRKLAELRLKSKSNLAKNRAERFLAIGAPFPVPTLYYGTHTGRNSGQDSLNMLNLPAGGRLRRALTAPPGHKLVICDSGQIEIRTVAWLAQCQKLLEVIRESDAGRGPDPYVWFGADNLYHCDYDDVTKEQRKYTKPVLLGAQYGQGWRGLQVYAQQVFGVAMTEPEAQRNIQAYRRAFPEVVQLWDRVMTGIKANGETVLSSGRKVTYPDLRYEGRELYYSRHSIFSKQYVGKRDDVKLWHGLAVENWSQAEARDIVMWQTLELSKRWRVVLSCYDEIVLCVPEDKAEEARRDALEVFGTAPPWAPDLPLIGEAVISDNYGVKP